MAGLAGHVVDRYEWLCHAYCLMDNHYELLIETPQPNLSIGMRQLNGRYTQAYHRQHERVGQIAEHIGVHVAAVSRRLKQAEQSKV